MHIAQYTDSEKKWITIPSMYLVKTDEFISLSTMKNVTDGNVFFSFFMLTKNTKNDKNKQTNKN